MKGKNIVMNFSHAYEEERFFKSPYFEWIDCTHLQGTDCYCDPEAAKTIKELISPYSPEGIHWIDSGNYHYLTKFWTDKIDRPFSMIVFDHHPDMQPALFSELLSCGCWVRAMLDTNPLLQKVCIIGASDSLKKETEGYDNRIRYYSEQTMQHENVWKEFSHNHLNEPVYVSVDKDVLAPEYAATNWDQGSLTLEELKKILSIIMHNERIIGIDICGEAPESMGQMHDWFESEEKNEHTNEELFSFIAHYIKK